LYRDWSGTQAKKTPYIIGLKMLKCKQIDVRAGEVILVRGDIDIRLLDYFYFSHSEVEKANSLVVIEEEKDSTPDKSDHTDKPESNEKH
jgi:hypothetical protein